MPLFSASPSEPVSDVVQLADLILTTARALHAREAADLDFVKLTMTETNVMRFIGQHPGATPSEVATATGLQRSNLSATLRSLEYKGLVERTEDASDRRSYRLNPTTSAQENLGRLHDLWRRIVEDALGEDYSGMGEAIGLLTRLDAGLERDRAKDIEPARDVSS